MPVITGLFVLLKIAYSQGFLRPGPSVRTFRYLLHSPEATLMGKAQRPRPKKLAEKLLAIRTNFGFSQNELIRALNFKELELTQGTISNYEYGVREPSLPLLLRYARLAGVTVEQLIDDDVDLPNLTANSKKALKSPRNKTGDC